MAQLLDSFKDLDTIPDNYTYKSPVKKAKYLWTLFFGFLTGDLNPMHINPFTASQYKSKLGGLSRHGISTTAEAESFVHEIFKFSQPTEIIATGYDKIEYLIPVRIGDKVVYSYTLLKKSVSEEKNRAKCCWEIIGINQNGKKVFFANWNVLYFPVEKLIRKVTVSTVSLCGGVVDCEMTDKEFYIFNIYRLLITIVIGAASIWLVSLR